MTRAQNAPQTLTVFYDGSCPLCVSEISYYKRVDSDQALNLVDVSSERFSGDDRINPSDAMARFHVRLADGRQLSGAQGFVEVWRVIPSLGWLAKLTRLPGAVPILEMFYRLFLSVRPIIVLGFTKCQRVSGRPSAR